MLALQTTTTVVEQTTTTVAPIVVQGTDWWTVGISAFAVTLAAAVGILTVLQGRAIRNIETREHEWEQQDRISAHIQVTEGFFQQATTKKPHGSTEPVATFKEVWYIRLTNTGRATAHEVHWTIQDAESSDLPEVDNHYIDHLDELHPGEHFDLYGLEWTDSGLLRFTTTWNDERGAHTNTRLISWY